MRMISTVQAFGNEISRLCDTRGGRLDGNNQAIRQTEALGSSNLRPRDKLSTITIGSVGTKLN
jgi:hypothetical protein